jgi:3-oxoacyl-[acyl-carrier protein] reductase
MKLQNKVAVVTGGARDIGKAISKKLAAEGAKVVINYFSSEQGAQETVAEIKAAGGEAVALKGDLTKAAEVQKLAEFTKSSYGDTMDILVNNVGGLVARKTLEEQDEAFFDTMINLNAKSTWMAIKAFVGNMKENGGAVINISSQAARDGGGGGASLYGAAKGFVTTYSRGLSKELGPKGIRVNSICPGMIDTTFHDVFTPDAVREKVKSVTPMRREGTGEDVANLVAFLASDDAAYITGANYDINGGLAFS